MLLADWFTHLCLVWMCSLMVEALQPPTTSTTCVWWSWWHQQLFERRTNDHCSLPTHSLSDCGWESSLCRPPSTHTNPHLPPKSHLTCHLSPWPPGKNNPKITSRPHGETCQAFAFIAVRTREGGGTRAWQLFEGVEGGGCEAGQCHTKGGQEGKISHPWSVRQRTHFFSGGVCVCGGVSHPLWTRWTNKYLTQAEGSPKSKLWVYTRFEVTDFSLIYLLPHILTKELFRYPLNAVRETVM